MKKSGIKDKYGKEICEGDTIKAWCCDDCDDPYTLVKCVYKENGFRFEHIKKQPVTQLYTFPYKSESKKYEIISNQS